MKLKAFIDTPFKYGDSYAQIGTLSTSGKEVKGFSILPELDNELAQVAYVYPEVFAMTIHKRLPFEYFLLSEKESNKRVKRRIEFVVPKRFSEDDKFIFYVSMAWYEVVYLDYLFQKRWYLNKNLLVGAIGGFGIGNLIPWLLKNLPEWIDSLLSLLK